MLVVVRKTRSAFIRLHRFLVSARFGASPDTIYGDDFYDDGGFSKTEETAASITSYIAGKYHPRSVLDVGCGMGNYLAYFAKDGCETLGVEGSQAAIRRVPETVLAIQHDLRKPLRVNRKFDLVMSVEVAEHIPRKYSETLVDAICNHARDLVVFTAAPPGTPGNDHVNCRDREFWDDLFGHRGFSFNAGETQELIQHARVSKTADWFQRWAYVYRRAHIAAA